MRKHLFIPDTQVEPDVPIHHLRSLGYYIVDKKPDVIIHAGDFADMRSLSSYDHGKKAGENARYQDDIEAAVNAMSVLLSPMREYNADQRKKKLKQYKPRMILTLGNHENRINRHVNTYAYLENKLSTDDLKYKEFGWEVHDFLDAVSVDGILYSHFFPRNAAGRITQSRNGAPSALLQVRRELQSCTSGHLQGLDFAVQQAGTRRYYGIIAGSFYLHECDYLTPQGTAYWRGVIMKNEVEDGEYDPCFISIDYLLKRYS